MQENMHFPFNEIAQLQSAAYSWTKTPITETFLEVLRRERMF